MGEVYTYNATHLTTIRDVRMTQRAELGAPGDGTWIVDDTDGTLAIVGQKDVSATQSSCSVPLTFRGFVEDRQYGRSAGAERAPHVGAARGISIALTDLNAMLGFRLIDGTDGKRPAETVAERGAWLMASDYVSGLFEDNGRCDFSSSKGMDKADYRNQYPGDVLGDMALAQTGVNYYIADWGSGPELTFRDDNASTADTSTLRISNVLADASSVTLNPFKDATLTRKPGNVYSKIAYSYAKGTRIRERTATATAFNGERGGTASNSNVKTAAKADDEGDALLWQHHTEEDSIDCTVLVTDAQVNLILAGHRIQAKFSHLNVEGYGSFTWFRVLERTVTPIVADGELYELDLRLSPQEDGSPVGAIIQSAFGRGFTAGLDLTLPNPPQIAADRYLVCIQSARLDVDPDAPNTTTDLPNWGTGAWTRLNGATITTGVSAYYKLVDSTEQTCRLGTQNVVAGVWEVVGNVPAATIFDESSTVGGPAYSFGSIGTLSVGQFALACWSISATPSEFDWVYGPPVNAWQTPDPNPGISAGWTIGISKWTYDHWSRDAFIPASPWTTIADALGTGAALTPSVTPGETGHEFSGLVLKIVP